MKKILAILCLLVPVMAVAIPISAGFVPVGILKGGSILFMQQQRTNLESSDLIPSISDPHASIDATILGGAYYLSKNVPIGFLLPYVNIKAANPLNQEIKSLADPVLFSSYRLHSMQGLGWFFSTGAYGSIGIPVGEFKRAGMPRGFQVGKGNWSQTIALNSFYEDIDKMVAINLAYTNHIKGNRYRHANQLDYNLSFACRVYPWVFKDWVEYPFEIMANLEFLGTYKWKQHAQNPMMDGANIDTKGNLIKIAPGIKLEAIGFQFGLQYLKRLSDSLNGNPAYRFKDSWVLVLRNEFA